MEIKENDIKNHHIKLNDGTLINLKDYIKEEQREVLRDFNRCVDKDMYRDAERKWNGILF